MHNSAPGNKCRDMIIGHSSKSKNTGYGNHNKTGNHNKNPCPKTTLFLVFTKFFSINANTMEVIVIKDDIFHTVICIWGVFLMDDILYCHQCYSRFLLCCHHQCRITIHTVTVHAFTCSIIDATHSIASIFTFGVIFSFTFPATFAILISIFLLLSITVRYSVVGQEQ